ncbi:MAG: hypothetical protein DMF77_06130 [Acidobacteria bacterium]|nr:MAG: hypothetical protein DMF77_06130 [Acidobacteriota bacterium]
MRDSRTGWSGCGRSRRASRQWRRRAPCAPRATAIAPRAARVGQVSKRARERTRPSASRSLRSMISGCTSPGVITFGVTESRKAQSAAAVARVWTRATARSQPRCSGRRSSTALVAPPAPKRSSCRAISSAPWYRSAGLAAVARATMRSSMGGMGAPAPPGSRPVTISRSTTPTANTSMRGSGGAPARASGAR